MILPFIMKAFADAVWRSRSFASRLIRSASSFTRADGSSPASSLGSAGTAGSGKTRRRRSPQRKPSSAPSPSRSCCAGSFGHEFSDGLLGDHCSATDVPARPDQRTTLDLIRGMSDEDMARFRYCQEMAGAYLAVGKLEDMLISAMHMCDRIRLKKALGADTDRWAQSLAKRALLQGSHRGRCRSRRRRYRSCPDPRG